MASPKKVLVDLDFNSTSTGVNVKAPVNAGDIANKAYVDSLIEGLAWKDNVRVASTANTNILVAPSSIDGITLALNDRVLIKDQTTASENGIYIFAGSGSALVRADDASTFNELESAVVSVDEGTNANITFRQTQVNGVIDTNDVLWTSFGTAAPAASTTVAGLIEIATQSEVDAGISATTAVTPATLAAWVNAPKRFAADFGTAVDTQYTLTHNLGTEDVVVEVYDNATNETVITLVDRVDANNILVCVTAAPGVNALRAVVLA